MTELVNEKWLDRWMSRLREGGRDAGGQEKWREGRREIGRAVILVLVIFFSSNFHFRGAIRCL